MKNTNDPIGNRTRDLPACSAVPQPTAPPRISMADTDTVKLLFYYVFKAGLSTAERASSSVG